MAELISWSCSNIKQTQATLTFEYSKTWETPRADHIREYHPAVELLSPIGILGTIEFIE
jgi:hypothetical protein